MLKFVFIKYIRDFISFYLFILFIFFFFAKKIQVQNAQTFFKILLFMFRTRRR